MGDTELTLTPTYANNTPKNMGGECMSGSVHFQGNRWVIHIYWQGKRHKIWRDYDSFQPFFTKKRALMERGKIESKVIPMRGEK